jgi:hypothetical protein
MPLDQRAARGGSFNPPWATIGEYYLPIPHEILTKQPIGLVAMEGAA